MLSGALVGFGLGLVGGGGSNLATLLLLYIVRTTNPHVAIGTGPYHPDRRGLHYLAWAGRRLTLAAGSRLGILRSTRYNPATHRSE